LNSERIIANSALTIAIMGNHGPNSTPLPFFNPGITMKGSLTVRFSDMTLKGG
jgi:hypothetical protein